VPRSTAVEPARYGCGVPGTYTAGPLPGDDRWGTDIVYRVVGVLRGGWTVQGIYLPVEGDWRLADLHVYPHAEPVYSPAAIDRDHYATEDEYHAALVSRIRDALTPTPAATLAAMPAPHGLYGEVLRGISLPEMRAAIDRDMAEGETYTLVDPSTPSGRALMADSRPVEEARLHAPMPPKTTPPSPARLLYLQAAVLYSRQSNPSRGATADAVQAVDPDDYRPTDSEVRDRLQGARRAGYLTKPGEGRKGDSRLTAAGEQLRERYINPNGSIRKTPRKARTT
jgi:hypothetical protein